MLTVKTPGLRQNHFVLLYTEWNRNTTQYSLNELWLTYFCIPQSSGQRRSNYEEGKVENRWRRYESLSGKNSTLSRSISMEMLAQPDLVGPNARRALFESKKYASSPRLNVTPQAKSGPVSHIASQWREAPTGWEKVYSGDTTVTNAKKDKAHQVCVTVTSCFISVCATWAVMTQERSTNAFLLM